MPTNEEQPEKSAERPFECSECKKPTAVLYTVIEQGTVSNTVMCSSCPQLECRLHGTASLAQGTGQTASGQSGAVCPECGTSLANVLSGMPLGCSQCYETFADQLINELTVSNKLLPKERQKGDPLHVGRNPGEAAGISPALKLHALNQALADTLQREDYEQAAWLRDQIKQLTEKSNEGQ